ncbi:MAG: hypothetical protein U9Q15_00290 [Patescibacteria group bacterium]|nr:hypothetical protein [Patescibacteria group bacterium]
MNVSFLRYIGVSIVILLLLSLATTQYNKYQELLAETEVLKEERNSLIEKREYLEDISFTYSYPIRILLDKKELYLNRIFPVSFYQTDIVVSLEQIMSPLDGELHSLDFYPDYFDDSLSPDMTVSVHPVTLIGEASQESIRKIISEIQSSPFSSQISLARFLSLDMDHRGGNMYEFTLDFECITEN